MLPRRAAPRRYQLDRDAARAVRGGHPWVFRRHISSAADVFADGQWLRLVDGANAIVGYGQYEVAGAIGIRVARRGPEPPDGAWVARAVAPAIERRAALRETTDAFRALHGESDSLPGVTLDVYGDTGVLQTYTAGADALGRAAAACARRQLGLRAVSWRPARRRIGAAGAERTLHGSPPAVVRVREDDRAFAVALAGGQKSGAFLDLRGLRRRVAAMPLRGARVLDLFSYTGALGVSAARAGAREVWHVDASEAALAFGREHHGGDAKRWICADVFDGELPAGERFDLIVCDPPQMTSRATQVPRALAAYGRLYRRLVPHLAPGGTLVACCCTARIDERALRDVVDRATGLAFVERLPPEVDHPVGFPEADYLKILVYQAPHPTLHP
jgi:23S rRNA (cytosine1962-C5)-methyltransferase